MYSYILWSRWLFEWHSSQHGCFWYPGACCNALWIFSEFLNISTRRAMPLSAYHIIHQTCPNAHMKFDFIANFDWIRFDFRWCASGWGSIDENCHASNCDSSCPYEWVYSSRPCGEILRQWLNTLKPRQNCRHFADDIFKCIFLNENVWISFKISMKFVPKVELTIFQHWFR